MVPTHSDILAGIVDSASLTDQDVASLGCLTAEQFNA